MKTKRKVMAITPVLLSALAALTAPTAIAAATKSDFNGDGWGDLAVGVPGENVNGQLSAGAINVIYGSARGLSGSSLLSSFITQDSPSCGDTAQVGDEFGHALATGDFNKDGFSDLAVGAPYDDVGGAIFAGIIHVFYGSSTGLSCSKSVSWSQGALNDPSEQHDWFGEALAAGDFNNDGYADLAIGARGEDIPGFTSAGMVSIMYGGSTGLTAAGAQQWHLNSLGVLGVAVAGDNFGWSLAAGNFGKSSHADLAIGIPFKQIGTAFGAGAVSVLYGSNSGLSGIGSQFWTQDMLQGSPEPGDVFGHALTAGNFGMTGHEDLVISAANENVLTGVVHAVYGSNTGLTASGNQLWWGNGQGERYGEALVAGNFGHGVYVDLAIGAPYRDIGGFADAGAVQVLYGTSTGLSSANSQSLNMGFGVAKNDNFGAALAAANFGNSSHFDLAIGVPGRKVGALANAGAVSVRYGSPNGLASVQVWTQDSVGIPDQAEANDRFGAAVLR